MLVEDVSLTSLQVTSYKFVTIVPDDAADIRAERERQKAMGDKGKKAARHRNRNRLKLRLSPLTFDNADAPTCLEVADSVLLLSGWADGPFFAERFRVSRWISAIGLPYEPLRSGGPCSGCSQQRVPRPSKL